MLSTTACMRAGDGNVSLLLNLTLLFASLAHPYKQMAHIIFSAPGNHPSFQTFGETLRGTDWLTLSTSQSCLLQDTSGHGTSTDTTTFVEQGGGRVHASALRLIAQSTMSHGHYRQSCQFIYSPKNLFSKELLLPGIGR